jgi:hypothetical protein
MKIKKLTLIFGLSLCPVWGIEPYDEIDLKIYQTLGARYQGQDQSWLTDELRPLVIEKILKRREKSSKAFKNVSDEQLVSIGHIETIQRMVEESQTDRNNHVLIDSATEAAIPYLMPIVYTGSTEIPKATGDIGYSSIRDYFVLATLRAIMRSNFLPEETKAWEKKIRYNSKRVDLLKQWWENNQTAIIEKRYSDATWLPRYKGRVAIYDATEMAERKADEERERANREARRTGDSGTKPAAAEAPSTNSGLLWGIIVTIVALLSIFIRWKLAARRN